MWCGTVPLDGLNQLDNMVQAIVQKHKSAGDSKSSNGFSHTPALMHAAAGDAIRLVQQGLGLSSLLSLTPPQGGFTDVGRHSGTEPRNTAWPLVAQVIRVRELLELVCCRKPCSTRQ